MTTSHVTSGRSTRRAMTIVELLVALAIVALLIAILTPAIGAVRTRARNALDASNLRQHTMVMAQYVADWHDTHPIFLDPRRARSTMTWDSRGRVFDETSYFLSCLAWPVALADAYYGGSIAEDAFWLPDEPLSRAESGSYTLLTTSYNYPLCLSGAPPVLESVHARRRSGRANRTHEGAGGPVPVKQGAARDTCRQAGSSPGTSVGNGSEHRAV